MFLGRVIGNIWSTVKWREVEGIKLLAVQPYHLADLAPEVVGQVAASDQPAAACHDLVVCADVLDAGVGDDVIIAYGHAARVALHEALGSGDKPTVPVDAAVVAVVDRMHLDPAALDRAGRSSR